MDVETINQQTKRKKSKMINSNNDLLKVNQPATYSIGSDSYPLTVIEVKGEVGKRQVTLRGCNATATKNSDYYNHQRYLYTENPYGELHYIKEQHLIRKIEGCDDEFFKQEPREIYRECAKNPRTGRLVLASCGTITVGVRNKHRDPHF